MLSPITLVSKISSLVSNQILEFEQTSLQNPFRTAMLVDEFRFFFTVLAPAPTDFTSYLNVAFRYRADIKLGRAPLTNGFVPTGLLSPLVQETGPLITAATGNALGSFLPKMSFTWPLKKPLYVPPTEQLIIRAQCLDPFGTLGQSISPYVAVAARSLPRDFPEPETVCMPWASAFVSPEAELFGNSLFTTTTAETDLVNPFAEPVRVHRFMGRMYNNALFGPGVDQFVEAPNGLSTRTLVRAADSLGTIIVRDPTPFTQLFFFGLRSWEPKALAAPKTFYIFSVDQDYSDVQGAGAAGFGISMIGDREVRMR
jgi:hypothetical protein